MLAAAKAGAVAKTAGAVLREWNRLPPDGKARLRGEAADVTRHLNELRHALGARLFGANDEELSWEDARALALSPRSEFHLARAIVDLLRARGEMEEREISAQFAAGRHSRFEQALAIASEDGYVESVRPGRWRITSFADQVLVETEDAAFLEAAIVEHVRQTGLAGREELALSVGAPEFRSASFLAAMERALASGAIQWLAPGLYGLPPDDLRELSPPVEAVPSGSERGMKAIARDLAREVNELRVAVAVERSGGPMRLESASGAPEPDAPAPPPAPRAAGSDDPIALLPRLKELADAGVLTAEEFERKKAEILAQV